MSSPKKAKNPEKNNQLWFFLREQMSITQFEQVTFTYEISNKTDLSLQFVLNVTKTKGHIRDYAFYMHSDSMAASVRLLSDESIIATYNLYCRNDAIVTIAVRPINDPSPNTSHTPSYHSSLAERRKVSQARGLLAPELFIQPKVRHVSGSTDPFTLETIDDEDNMVSLKQGDEFVIFAKDYLLGWIGSQISDLKRPTDIVVQSYREDGTYIDINLTADVWQHSLLRGPWKDAFAPIWEKYITQQVARDEEIDMLANENSDFRHQCRNFIQDLRAFGTNRAARGRLEGTGHEFYIGKPYFDDAVRDRLLALPTQGSTLEAELRALARKRAGSTICASHDLAPLFESALNVQWDNTKGSAVLMPLSIVHGFSLRGKAKEVIKKGSKLLKETLGRKKHI